MKLEEFKIEALKLLDSMQDNNYYDKIKYEYIRTELHELIESVSNKSHLTKVVKVKCNKVHFENNELRLIRDTFGCTNDLTIKSLDEVAENIRNKITKYFNSN